MKEEDSSVSPNIQIKIVQHSQKETPEEENVDFDEFLCGIRTTLMFQSFFEEMETIFKHLDY